MIYPWLQDWLEKCTELGVMTGISIPSPPGVDVDLNLLGEQEEGGGHLEGSGLSLDQLLAVSYHYHYDGYKGS